jgi:hypothetical protein
MPIFKTLQMHSHLLASAGTAAMFGSTASTSCKPFPLSPIFTHNVIPLHPGNYQPTSNSSQVVILRRMNPLKIEIRLPTAPPPARTKRNSKDVGTLFIEFVAPKQTSVLHPPCRCSALNLTPCQITFIILFILYLALCILAWAVYKDHVTRSVVRNPFCASISRDNRLTKL